jgi:hypothetical protein
MSAPTVNPYAYRAYTSPKGKWLVHGPTLPELGFMCPSENDARALCANLWDAMRAGIEMGQSSNGTGIAPTPPADEWPQWWQKISCPSLVIKFLSPEHGEWVRPDGTTYQSSFQLPTLERRRKDKWHRIPAPKENK